MDHHHKTILSLIELSSGTGTQHTFLDSYLGNSHPRYVITAPTMRMIAREWMKDHKKLSCKDFHNTLDSLIHGKSATEKTMVGILLDLASKDQSTFDPNCFDEWLDHLVGWAEVDSVCTGNYTIEAIPNNLAVWKKLLTKLSGSKNINKRRASIVFLCSPLRKNGNPRLAELALTNIDRLKGEKEILITKAISWVLRSMVKHHRKMLEAYLKKNSSTLPAIAVRETMTKLKTGRKTGKPDK
jgi:3-methyladenine DNA glycosylase AlkD